MEGRYSIDPKTETARNFKNFAAAVARLISVGVKGPVQFVVAPGAYEESIELPALESASETHSILWKSAKPGLATLAGGGGTMVLLEGAHDYVLDGFAFQSNSTAIRGEPATSAIEIRNCSFRPGLDELRGQGVLSVKGNGTAADWRIHHNKFEILGGSHGLHFSKVSRFEIHDNEFTFRGVNNGLYFINRNDGHNRIHHNLFTGTAKIAVHVAASNLDNDIHNNLFLTESPSGYAIESFGTAKHFNRIHGNLIAVSGGGGGVLLSHSNLLHFKADGNLYCCTSGQIGTIRSKKKTSNYEDLRAWQKATAELPEGTADEAGFCADQEFLKRHADLLALIKTGVSKSPATIERAIAMLSGPDSGPVRLAIHAVGRAGREGRKAVPQLTTLCRHPDKYVRSDAVHALGTIRMTAEIAIPEITKLLDDEDPLVLTNAVRALAVFGPFSVQAVPRLERLLRNHDAESNYSKRTVQWALRMIRGG